MDTFDYFALALFWFSAAISLFGFAPHQRSSRARLPAADEARIKNARSPMDRLLIRLQLAGAILIAVISCGISFLLAISEAGKLVGAIGQGLFLGAIFGVSFLIAVTLLALEPKWMRDFPTTTKRALFSIACSAIAITLTFIGRAIVS